MTLIVTRSDVRAIIQSLGDVVLRELMDRIEAGHREMADGLVRQHSRVYLRYPEEGARRPPGLFSMSALLAGSGLMGTRLLALSGVSGEGVLVLFDHVTLKCLAIVDDVLLHEYRTGAPAGLASRYMARPNARVLGCFGSSGIARGTINMVCCALPSIEKVLVYSPNQVHRARFAEEMSVQLKKPVIAVDTPAEAANEADVLITATDADRPVVPADAIRPGTHINAMARNEIPMETLRTSAIITAWREGDRLMDPPVRDPLPEEWLRGELTDLVTGRLKGRANDQEITVFLSGGGPPAMWDVEAAATVFEAARRTGHGTVVEITG